VKLGPLRLSLWAGLAVRTERIEAGTPEGARLVAGPVRLRPAVVPLIRGRVDLRAIVAEAVTITRPDGPLLGGGRLRARFSQSGEDVELEGTLRGTWAALPGAPTGSLTLKGGKRGSTLDLSRFLFQVGSIHLDLQGRAENVGTGRSRWKLSGSGRGPTSQGRGEITLALAPDTPRLDLALDFERVDFRELAALAGWASAGAVAAAAPEPSGAAQPPFLARLQGGGTLRAKAARLAGLDLEDLATDLVLDRGTVRLQDAAFGLYGGRHLGTLALDARTPGVPFTLRSRVERLDVARLLVAWSPGSAGVFRGTGAVDLDLSGVAYAPEVLRTLSGTLRLDIRDGALTTVGLLETVAALLEAAGGRGIGRDQTPFRSLGGSFAVTSGVAHTDDLALLADDLRLDVRGDVDLTGPLVLEGVVSFSPEVSASMVQQTGALQVRQGADGRLTVPLTVRGTLSAPKVQVDVQRILKEGIREESRQALQRKVEKTTKKLLDRLRR
jgi:AsmA protein